MAERNRSEFLGLLMICLGWGHAGISAEPLPALDELLKQYQALGLPLPPKEAKLVRYEAGGGGIVNDVVQPKYYGLAFELKPETKTENTLILRGTQELRPDWSPHSQEVKPAPPAAKEVDLDPGDELVLAIQCHERGWNELARHLLERSQVGTKVLP